MLSLVWWNYPVSIFSSKVQFSAQLKLTFIKALIKGQKKKE